MTFTCEILTTNAEMIWALVVIMAKYSFNSNARKNELLSIIFPYSAIAKDFSSRKIN